MTTRFSPTRPSARQCLALSGWAVLLWMGCASRGQLELLEAEIRQHKDGLTQARAKTSDLESQLVMARRETELIRSQIASHGGQAPLPEQTGNLVRLAGVKINTLLSGGKDRDGQPGDDLLVALISPHDEQGDLVKIAGEVEIEAYDMTRPGDDKRVGRWTFNPDQTAKAWHSGFVGSGLRFELPWQEAPANKELLVHARLKTTDGRQFDTNSPLKVVPPASAAPALLQVPQAQPVKYESEQKIDREIHPAIQQLPVDPVVRPVPFYDDVEPAAARPFPGMDKQPADEPAPAQKPGRASLDGTQTSDNWTDDTIPRLR
jgi:hypothetical protein